MRQRIESRRKKGKERKGRREREGTKNGHMLYCDIILCQLSYTLSHMALQDTQTTYLLMIIYIYTKRGEFGHSETAKNRRA